jgi:hypothetical protein
VSAKAYMSLAASSALSLAASLALSSATSFTLRRAGAGMPLVVGDLADQAPCDIFCLEGWS